MSSENVIFASEAPQRGSVHGPALVVRPLPLRRAPVQLGLWESAVPGALETVARLHRRLPRLQGGFFAVAAWKRSNIVGVAVVGWPSRTQTVESVDHLRVLRLATDGTENACSILYGACWRAARAMGCQRMDTHTHLDEPGTSIIAAGWVDGGITKGGEHDRSATGGRRRAPAVDPRPKRRWWAPGSRMADGTIVRREEAA